MLATSRSLPELRDLATQLTLVEGFARICLDVLGEQWHDAIREMERDAKQRIKQAAPTDGSAPDNDEEVTEAVWQSFRPAVEKFFRHYAELFTDVRDPAELLAWLFDDDNRTRAFEAVLMAVAGVTRQFLPI